MKKLKRTKQKEKEERRKRKENPKNHLLQISQIFFAAVPVFNPVLQPSGVPGESQLVLTDGWDGWMDGWMDGLVRTQFCSAYISETTRYMTLIFFMPPRRRFKTSFVRSDFLKFLIFSKNFEQIGGISRKLCLKFQY